jgi:preprotein translocase subunit SecB
MPEDNEELPQGEIKPEGQGQFGLQKIYAKDVSFETPNSPSIFKEQWKPTVNMDIAHSASSVGEESYEVVLSVTVTVNFENKTVYLIEIQQAGVFHVSGLADDILDRTLATACPNILFPFAREMVSDLVTRGGFPQLLLAPVNFEVLYMQRQQQKEQEQEQNISASETNTTH